MKSKIILLLIAVMLCGCGKNNADDSLVDYSLDSEEYTNSEESERILYTLKPVEIKDDAEVIEEYSEPDIESFENDFGIDNSNLNDNYTVDFNGASVDSETGIDLDVIEVLSKMYIPENAVIQLMVGDGDLCLWLGGTEDYRVLGTDSCFMWESPNGTFYYDGESVKEVEVEFRSALFDESASDSDIDISSSINIEDNVDISEIMALVNLGATVECTGIEELNGVECYKIHIVDGDAEAELMLSTDDSQVIGLAANQNGPMVAMIFSNYKSFYTQFEPYCDGTIDDETASATVQGAIMMSVIKMAYSMEAE